MHFMGGTGLLADCNTAETASQILCDSEILAELRFCHLGRHFMKTGDYHEIPLGKKLYFAVGMGLL
jgi:hypothetical protein